MTVNLSFDELTAKIDRLLGEEVAYLPPERCFWFMSILAEPGYKISSGWIINYYPSIEHPYPSPDDFGAREITEPTESAPENLPRCPLPGGNSDQVSRCGNCGALVTGNLSEGSNTCFLHNFSKTLVIHGHTIEVPCYANSFCHLYGYRPNPSNNPGFTKLFYMKWPNLVPNT